MSAAATEPSELGLAHADSRSPVSADEALRMWKALVQGRWSPVDCFDRDGKRFVLARRSAHGCSPASGLEPLELDVARLTALGHSYKYIAYELGISRSTVVRKLDRAIGKLGVVDRRELARRFGANLA